MPIPLKALTVFSGLNGSGKSTVLQAIALLRQSLDVERSEGVTLQSLHLHGPLIQLGNASDVLSERATDDIIEFTISTEQEEWTCSTKITELTKFESILCCNLSINSKNSHEEVEKYKEKIKNSVEIFLKRCEFQFLQADRLTPSTHYERSVSVNHNAHFLGVRGQYTPDFLAVNGNSLIVAEARRCPVRAPGVEAELMNRLAATPKLYDHISGWLPHLSPGVK